MDANRDDPAPFVGGCVTVMTEHGHHANAYAKGLQYLTQLIACLYGNVQRTFFGRGVEARRGIPEQSPPRRADLIAVLRSDASTGAFSTLAARVADKAAAKIAVRIRYRNTVAVLRSHEN
jgi:hypothetical protein